MGVGRADFSSCSKNNIGKIFVACDKILLRADNNYGRILEKDKFRNFPDILKIVCILKWFSFTELKKKKINCDGFVDEICED